MNLSDEEQKQWLSNITSHIQSQGLPSPNVEVSHIELAIKVFRCCPLSSRTRFPTRFRFQENCNAGLEDSETVFSVIKAYDVPKYKYDIEKKKYIIDKAARSLLPAAGCRSEFLIDRYTMLWQRTNRHELFASTVPGTSDEVKKFKLRKIESLLSCSSLDEIVVLGLLAKLTEAKFFIEDPTGSVPLDLSSVQYHSGFFCEGCFVLVEGSYSDGTLKAAGIGFPPVEAAESSRAYFGSLNTWGGRSSTLLKSSQRLLDFERANTEATIVFLSDCWLDEPTVVEKLQVLFDGYNEMPPVAIVLMGPFMRNISDPFSLKGKVTAFAEFVANNCPMIKKQTDIVLVPALEDPAAPVIMPRPPLPEKLCADAKRLLPRLILATNPCRLQYCTQQIAVCRADLITKLCRNTINFPQTGKLEDHVCL